MNAAGQTGAKTLALFEQRIAGDDCLMKLASRRFSEAGMGAEMHAATPEHLEWLMSFRPGPAGPVVLHLPRDYDLMDKQAQDRMLAFAARFSGRIHGFVLHDHSSMVSRKNEYLAAARCLNSALKKLGSGPLLFIEYAVGLEPGDFAGFFASISDLDRITACIDIGHVGIRAARAAYAKTHRGEDICALKTQPDGLSQLMPSVDAAVASGLAAVLDLVRAIAALRKPIHFHLHDGHPLSTFSPFGVSDHLSFLTGIPLKFEYRGQRSVAPMFGPAGLARVVKGAGELMGSADVSFTLEIHPTSDREPLGDSAPLFAHWTDKTNAEQMNHWVKVLIQNHSLLLQALQGATCGF